MGTSGVHSPETRYARAGDLHVAYQMFGSGPIDIVYLADTRSHIEALWEETSYERFFTRLGSLGRVILLDKRGTGLSDPAPAGELPTLEQWMEDVTAVFDDVGTKEVVMFGHVGGGSTAILFAATYPHRVRGLILLNTCARFGRAPDYPIGVPEHVRRVYVAFVEENWGTGRSIEATSPSVMTDERLRAWRGRYERLAASPGTAAAIERQLYEHDVRSVLPTIRVPTLVIHRRSLRFIRVGHGRYLAEHIPSAKYVELDGDDSFFFVGADEIFDEVQEWLTGSRYPSQPDRLLATVLMTDIVRSTELAAKLGDSRWRELLDRYLAVVRRQLTRFRGDEIKGLGDGVLATFDGPGRGVRCALAIREAVRGLGLEVRSGLHTGEIELVKSDIAGVAVHIAARVMEEACPGEILMTGTVRDLIAGSGLVLQDRGRRTLKGVPREWELLAVGPALRDESTVGG